jgi:thiamine pyrophosphate-dependent acetolactate synthase large subunit-like protein
MIDAAFPDQPLVLTLGGTIREMLAVVGQKPSHLYCLDAMGQPLAIGLGLGLDINQQLQQRGERGERVVVVEGDGSLLMGFSGLATVGHLKPKPSCWWCSITASTWPRVASPRPPGRPAWWQSREPAAGSDARDVDSTPDALSEALEHPARAEGPLLLRVQVDTHTLRPTSSWRIR